MLSILSPTWLKPNNFYPTWMGGIEIVTTITTGGSPTSPLYRRDKKIQVHVNSITLIQDNEIRQLSSLVTNKEFLKMVRPPKITVYKVKIKDDTN